MPKINSGWFKPVIVKAPRTGTYATVIETRSAVVVKLGRRPEETGEELDMRALMAAPNAKHGSLR